MEKLQFQYQEVDKDKLIDELAESPLLRDFFVKHDLTTDYIEDHLIEFLSYNTEKSHCHNCKGLEYCKQDNQGFEPIIGFPDGRLIRNYKKCQYLVNAINKTQDEQLIDAMHLPSRILEASLEDFDFNRGQNRTEVHNKINNFIQKYKRGERPKGLYLWGQNSVGKTYCISALAKELMKLHVGVVIAYYPDLVREFKSRVQNNSVEQIVSKLKQVDILMLDDIGGEGDSVWVRDEILGPILQYRLLDNKATFFTSNFSRAQLHDKHFSKFRDSDSVRSARIVTRIKELTKSEYEDFQIEM